MVSGIEQMAGETTIADDVIATIAAVAAREVQGVSKLGTSSIRRSLTERVGVGEPRARGVSVEVGKKEAIIDLTFNVTYGYSIPKIISEVRSRVASRISELAGLTAKEININVAGLEFEEKRESPVA
ncbi:MAG: Asp23/Gls24 family envelope stress response protein [Dehalococcoidia bacterium]|nr:Asp23/Gls24 family envelope stress response protein [Dehalococcoidia bacterium]